jgi:hypothetical protein
MAGGAKPPDTPLASAVLVAGDRIVTAGSGRLRRLGSRAAWALWMLSPRIIAITPMVDACVRYRHSY